MSPVRSRRGRAADSAAPLRTAESVQTALGALAEPARVPDLQRFFKTGRGEYAEGDRFRGLRVPQVRAVVRRAAALSLPESEALLASPWHEDRLAALLIVARQCERAAAPDRRLRFRLYLRAARAGRINNWDLVDVTAGRVVGAWLRGRPECGRTLDRLARSRSLWERRIAMLAAGHLIWHGEFAAALRLAARLRDDPHDLMHKAVGWMLREIGKRDRAVLDGFLAEHAARMPRTMLRYALEKHAPVERRRWLAAGR